MKKTTKISFIPPLTEQPESKKDGIHIKLIKLAEDNGLKITRIMNRIGKKGVTTYTFEHSLVVETLKNEFPFQDNALLYAGIENILASEGIETETLIPGVLIGNESVVNIGIEDSIK